MTTAAFETLNAFRTAGLQIGYKDDDNESRYSVEMSDGSKWILTVSKTDHWQNAHYHKGLEEFYVVVTGWVAVAKLERVRPQLGIIQAGWSFGFCQVPHNLFMPADTIVHTIKTGTPVPNPDKKSGADWWPDDELDQWSKMFQTVAEIEAAVQQKRR